MQEFNSMKLQEKIKNELMVSMKAKDSERTGAIRIIIGEFQRQMAKDLSDDEVIAIIKKLVKSEKELLVLAGKDGSAYLTILESYLPQQVGEDDIRVWINANIDFSTFKNKMQAMRPIMAHFGSTVDGNIVKQILESI
jgi:uncharacterized protein